MKITRRSVLIGGVLALAAIGLGYAQGPAGDAAAVPRVALDEVKKGLEKKSIVLIDVRALEAYREGHIAGALSVPMTSLDKEAARLKAMGKPIVTYCA